MKYSSYKDFCHLHNRVNMVSIKTFALWCVVLSVLLLFLDTEVISQTKTDNTTSRSSHTIVVSGKRNSLPTLRINSTSFIELNSILNTLGAVPQPDEYLSYEINERRLRLVPSSFLIACDEGTHTRIAQMTKPTLRINKIVYVPLTDFLIALQTLRLFVVEIKGLQSVLKSIDNNSPQSNELLVRSGNTPNQRISPIETPSLIKNQKDHDDKKISVDDTNSNETNDDIHTSPNTPPTRYKLPSDLKRRELTEPSQSKKKKDGSLLLWSSKDNLSCLTSSNYINVSPNKIVRVYPEVLSNKTLIHFVAKKKLIEPTLNLTDNVLTISFPNAINSQKSLDNIRKLNVKSVRSYLEQEAQVYEITLNSSEREANVSMISPQHAVVTIQSISGKANSTQIAKAKKKKWSLDVIVLDAGHGGKDDGAESINSIKEKTIALAIAKQTQKEIRKLLPKTNVYLTRDKDAFIELDKRGQLANANEGKLFISLHCNSMPTKPNPANGYEIYVLSPAKTDDAIASANRENAVIKLEADNERYAKLEDTQLILATLAQNSFVKLSQLFASELDKEIGKATTLKSRGVNQAAFIVLIGAAMPSVLIETGFLSNTKDEKYLTSAKGQSAIAKGIAKAILSYSVKYAKMM